MSKEINEKLAKLINKSDVDIDKLIVTFESELKRNYLEVLKDIKKELAKIYENFGDNVTFQEMAKYNRLKILEQQIGDILKLKLKDNIPVIERCKSEVFTETFNRYKYNFMKTTYLKVNFSMFDKKTIEANLVNKFDLIKWQDRYEDVIEYATKQVKDSITQSFIKGEGYGKTAKGINKVLEMDYNRALRIVRTEGQRARNTAKVMSNTEIVDIAKSEGLTAYKVWLSTLDERTRSSHRSMDKKKANKDGLFVLPSGVTAEAPSLSGIAEEDIHCRCTIITEFADFEAPKRLNNKTKETIDNLSYDQWSSKNTKV